MRDRSLLTAALALGVLGGLSFTADATAAPAAPPTTEQVDAGSDAGRDTELELSVGDALAILPALAGVQVRARAGIALLEGDVRSSDAREQAAKIASRVPGVLHVVNELTLAEPSPQERREARSEQDQLIDERLTRVFAEVEELAQVRVSTRSGVAQLTGTTLSDDARDKAETLAKELDGVVYVDNDIEQNQEVSERVEPTVERFKQRVEALLAQLPLIGVALLVIAGFVLLAKVVSGSDILFRPLSRNKLLRGVLGQMIGLAIVVAGVILALELLDATAVVGAVLGAAGLAGVALGFAFRDIVENYLASLLLGIRQPFAPCDHVMIGDHEGKVIRLTMRDTILMTLEGNHLRLPNAQVFKSVITNFTHNPRRRFGVEVGIGTNENLVNAQRVGREALTATPGVMDAPPAFSRVERLGDSSVQVMFFAWVDQRHADWYKVRSEGVRRLKAALDAAGVQMPVPIYRLEATNGITEPARQNDARGELERSAHEVDVDRHLEQQINESSASEADEDLLKPKR